uniref:Uncharacterized protein n=1 Tax=Arundo donax TaxID=35708 RepID=A0A0A9DSQ8_ARUDO
MKQIDDDLSSDQAFLSLDSDIGISKGSASISSPGCLNGSFDISETFHIFAPSNTVLPNVKDSVHDSAVEHCSSSMLLTVATSGSIDACADMDSSTIVVVDTVIVGRRFHENIELREDEGISFLRDPQNAKDPDAIKRLNVRGCLDTCLESLLKFWLL